ncbi:uncharacterized protein DSM5745_07918 [Aspergillus mulundensis]|uniref:Phytanoyl-CoA dioxygenase family protein n=1 Tax=Aspergillus mulundensis TaxID=1810919 RepID=A0A3D8RFK7_9EURO|nr:Uncharacterized protein DSM5745_07918 [Aspergillus mulundensis]RDW72746.1 Uncharacterized protein DSM5745_07918 [Aspergillus mulundensis]
MTPEPSRTQDQHPTYTLSAAEKNHFLEHGYVLIPQCFTREKAQSWTRDVWIRLGYSASDKSTWTSERINMPHHRQESARDFAPKAWSAICELCGGEDRISEDNEFRSWRDSLIVNLGSAEWEGKDVDPRELDDWHVDGDFFWHFLDSPEQALLVIPLFSDIRPRGGGTMICPEAIGLMARYLYEHPEGVSPHMVPRLRAQNPESDPGLTFYKSLIQNCTDFREMTGETGDVILIHPLMLHSASRNSLRIPRIITNPPVALKEPFNFDREDHSQYSLIEQKTLLALGKDRLRGWKIATERERIVPARMKKFYEMKVAEEKRLREAGMRISSGSEDGFDGSKAEP